MVVEKGSVDPSAAISQHTTHYTIQYNKWYIDIPKMCIYYCISIALSYMHVIGLNFGLSFNIALVTLLLNFLAVATQLHTWSSLTCMKPQSLHVFDVTVTQLIKYAKVTTTLHAVNNIHCIEGLFTVSIATINDMTNAIQYVQLCMSMNYKIKS